MIAATVSCATSGSSAESDAVISSLSPSDSVVILLAQDKRGLWVHVARSGLYPFRSTRLLPMTAPAPVRRTGGLVRRLAELAATPLVPTDFLDLVAPLRSGADLRARV